MPRRRLYPMPTEGLIDHPLAMTLPAAAFGMLTRLLLHFHVSGCRPLPAADHELMHIARAHAPTWRRWKANVLKVFHDIESELSAYHRQREGARQGLKIAARRGGSANAARLALRDLSQPPVIDAVCLPVTSPGARVDMRLAGSKGVNPPRHRPRLTD